jgi:fermentation-respiration switch protein FrsA (DUF1100 family)
MYVAQRSFLYFPSTTAASPAESGVSEMQVVRLDTGDGLALRSWYRPAADGKPTIVYFHGNAGHVGYRGLRVRPYLEAGLGVLLVEYRGYGGNPGEPTEAGLYEDGRAAVRFLAAQGVGGRSTILYGESLGCGVAVQIAAEHAEQRSSVAAVIVEAPLSSVTDVGAYHYPYLPVRWLLKDRFETRAKVAKIGAPLLVVHGTEDRIVPLRFGRSVFEAAAEPKEALWIAGGGHEDLERFGLHGVVLDFLSRHVSGMRHPFNGGRRHPLALDRRIE